MDTREVMFAVIGAYLVIGIFVLVVFDILTKRIRKRILDAAADTQIKVASANPFMGRGMEMLIGRKTALVLTVLAMWAFWPAVLYGYIESRFKKSKDRTED